MRVRSYYNETADLYLEALGPFCQAGLIEGFDPDPYRSTMMHIKTERISERDLAFWTPAAVFAVHAFTCVR